MKIREVIAAKASQNVITIVPDATVRDLIVLLAEHNIGAVVVSTVGADVAGIVSERDIVRRLVSDEALLDGPVSAIMTTQVRSCHSEQDVDELQSLMTEYRIRHVPVIDDGQLTGVVSIGDVVKSRMDQLQFERDQLDSYVRQS